MKKKKKSNTFAFRKKNSPWRFHCRGEFQWLSNKRSKNIFIQNEQDYKDT